MRGIGHNLAPESFSGIITQRMRWAQGMVQILLLKNPLTLPGLALAQRLCYFSNCFFWFFAYARLVFILAPAAFLLFGLHVYDASGLQLIAYMVPHLICATWVSGFIFRKKRWSFISELYELMLCVFTLPAIIQVFLRPRSPTFQVTPKGEQLDQDSISPLAKPFYFLIALTLLCLIVGLRHLFWDHHYTPSEIATFIWTVLNFILLLAAMGVLFEQRQLRFSPRVSTETPISFGFGDIECHGVLMDFSMGGAGVLCEKPLSQIDWLGRNVLLRITNPDKTSSLPLLLHADVHHLRSQGNGCFIGFRFQPRSQNEVAAKVALMHGESQRWIDFQEDQSQHRSTLSSLLFLARLGLRQSLFHFSFLFRKASRIVWSKSDLAWKTLHRAVSPVAFR